MMRTARARSFLLLGFMYTMWLSYTLPSFIITPVEIMFRTSFCAVPAFILVEPLTTSGPTTTAIAMSASRFIAPFLLQESATVVAPTERAYPSAPQQYAALPACGYRHTHVLFAKDDGFKILLRVFGYILHTLGRTEHRISAARDHTLYQLGRNTVCRRAFGGIDNAEPARRSGAYVYQSAARSEALGNKIYRARNVAELTLNGKRNGLVLIVYYAHYLRRRHFVDMSAVFVRLFGRKVTVIHNAPPLVIRYFQPQPRHSPP